MTDTSLTAAPPAAIAPEHRDTNKFFRALFGAAWMAILLGLVVQISVFAAKLGAGGKVPELQLLVDVASGIAWAVIVCGGVAIGTVASKSAPPLMGALGLICAPLAFAAAKGAQRGVAWMLGLPMEQINTLTYQIGGAKTIEYALLGLVLGLLIRTPRSTLINHALLGAGFGIVFSGVILWLNAAAAAAALPTPKIAGTIANEFIFPIGCSMVIYWVAKLSDHATARERILAGS